MSSSLTTALEEMTINNEQLRREVDVLKTDNTQLRTDNDAMKDEMVQLQINNDKQKDEIGKLTTLLDEMAINHDQKQTMIRSNDDLRRHTGIRKLKPFPRARQQPKVSQ